MTFRVLHLPCVSGNPYQSLLASHLRQLGVTCQLSPSTPRFFALTLLRGRFDTLHLHWAEWLFLSRTRTMTLVRLFGLTLQLIGLRLAGRRIVWTVHNVVDHEKQHLLLNLMGAMIIGRLAHAIIVHTPSSRTAVMHQYRIKDPHKITVIPHGSYVGVYENVVDRAVARQRLEIRSSALVFLFVGTIRPYKGVPELIDAFQQAELRDSELVVVGLVPDVGFRALIERRIGGDRRIRLFSIYVSDQELQNYLNSSDVVVLPFRDIATSGSLILAMSFGRPVIAPNLGSVGDVLDERGGFLYDPADPHALVSALKRASEVRADLLEMGTHNLELARAWNWVRVAEMTYGVYEAARQTRR